MTISYTAKRSRKRSGTGVWLTSVWSPLIVACAAATVSSWLTARNAAALERQTAESARILEEQRADLSAKLESQKNAMAAALAERVANQTAEIEREKLRIVTAADRAKRAADVHLAREEKIRAAVNGYSAVIGEEYRAENEFLYEILYHGYSDSAYKILSDRLTALAPKGNAAEIDLSLLDAAVLRKLHVMKDEITTVYSHAAIAKEISGDQKYDFHGHYQNIYTHLFYSQSLLTARLVNISHGQDANFGFTQDQLEKLDYQEFKDSMTITLPGAEGELSNPVYPFRKQKQ